MCRHTHFCKAERMRNIVASSNDGPSKKQDHKTRQNKVLRIVLVNTSIGLGIYMLRIHRFMDIHHTRATNVIF